MLRPRVIAPLVPTFLVLLLLTGCGSAQPTAKKSDDTSTSSEKSGSERSSTEKSPAPEPGAEKADADGMKTVTVQGISLRVPATWKPEHDGGPEDLYFWLNPGKGEKDGLVALLAQNTDQTAEAYIKQVTGKNGSLGQYEVTKRPVQVEGLGRGYRLRAAYKKDVSERVIVSTIDGLLLEVIYVADPDPAHASYREIVLSSIKRQL